MAATAKTTPVSVYFMPEWWDRHFHQDYPRPRTISRQGIEQLYLRRQRFLFEHFGEFLVGQEHPALGSGQIATVIRHGFDLIPTLLGIRLDLKDAWGFYPRCRTLADVHDLKPVDITRHPEGEWIRQKKARLESLYGRCDNGIDLGSVCNNAFRMIGEDLYLRLVEDPQGITALFEVLIATEGYLYQLLRELFPPMDPVPISNCNAHIMGPRHYEALVLPFDTRQNRFAEACAGGTPRAALHHCDVPVDDFIQVYARLPGVSSLQASLESDIALAKQQLPDCTFSALVHPLRMHAPLSDFDLRLRHALAQGVDDLALWNIDQQVDVPKVHGLLGTIRQTSAEFGRQAVFSALPLCWEELEWAHNVYGTSAQQGKD